MRFLYRPRPRDESPLLEYAAEVVRGDGSARSLAAVAALGVIILLLSGCLEVRYSIQAGLGQLDLWGRKRPVSDVLADEGTDPRTAALLAEVGHILAFARAHGLATHGNYASYVALDRPAVVWALTACRPLSLEPKLWTFPIAGSFPYLGWFDEGEARRIARRLAAEGWDVHVRSVDAYSTGGFFHDPVLSSMFSPDDDALRELARVLFHELTHANIFIKGQAVFNESLAVFVGQHMTADYLAQRFGAHSGELAAFRDDLAKEKARDRRMARAYADLARLYASGLSRRAKLAGKARILRKLDDDLELPYIPNNASLVGFETYDAGQPEFRRLYRICGSWRRFLAAAATVRPDDFPDDDTKQIGPIIDSLIAAGCPGAGRAHGSASRAWPASTATSTRPAAAARQASPALRPRAPPRSPPARPRRGDPPA